MGLIAILSEIVLMWVVYRLLRSRDVSLVLSTSIACFVLMWHVVPVFISVPMWSGLTRLAIVDLDAFARVATLDAITMALSLTALLWSKPYFAPFTRSAMARVGVGAKTALVLVLLGMALDWYTLIGYGDTLGSTYGERNAFAVTGGDTAAFRDIGILSFGHVLLTGFAFAALMTRWPSGTSGRLVRSAVMVWVGLITVQGLVEGSRIAALLPLMLLLLYAAAKRWPVRRFAARLAAAAGATFAVGGLAVLVIGEYRSAEYSMTGRDIVNGAVELAQTSRSPVALGQSLLGEIVTKFDSFSTGALLIERLGVGAAGWLPYEGAVLSLVPRRFVESKPVPGSIDGTYAGHPSRLVAVAVGMAADSGNVNVSPAAIAIWQLGYAGLLVLAVTNALYLYTLNTLLLSPGVIARGIGLSAIALPTLLTLYTTPETAIMQLMRVIALCLLILPALLIARRLAAATSSGRTARWASRAAFEPLAR